MHQPPLPPTSGTMIYAFIFMLTVLVLPFVVYYGTWFASFITILFTKEKILRRNDKDE